MIPSPGFADVKVNSWCVLILMTLSFIGGCLVANPRFWQEAEPSEIRIMPENLTNHALSVRVSGPVQRFFRGLLPDFSIASHNEIDPVKLALPESLELNGGSQLTFTERLTPIALIDSVAALGGLQVVWKASEIDVGEAQPSSNIGVFVASKALLYLALCSEGGEGLSIVASEITGAQEIKLIEELADWGINPTWRTGRQKRLFLTFCGAGSPDFPRGQFQNGL
jgi:hypothetical protein